ncbi:hypothetical protein [Rhodobacteraceae phage LS06-2018-MD06]|jgi:hypothetical protein|nr:hypothetical protein [Rhodobacteraceae phage LS06-2018-MD06]
MASQADIELRIDYLVKKMIKRYSNAMLKAAYLKAFKECTHRTFASDKRAAVARLKEVLAEERDERMAKALLAREELIRESHELGKLELVARVERDLGELEGLYKQGDDKQVNVVFDFGKYPAAKSLDGPVDEETVAEYNEAVAEGKDED